VEDAGKCKVQSCMISTVQQLVSRGCWDG